MLSHLKKTVVLKKIQKGTRVVHLRYIVVLFLRIKKSEGVLWQVYTWIYIMVHKLECYGAAKNDDM